MDNLSTDSADSGFRPYPGEPTNGRIFLVGNGPSLRHFDYDVLIGEEAWGMNRIHMMYEQTSWRPTRWWWSDYPQHKWQLMEIFHHVRSYPDEPAWLRADIASMLTGEHKPTYPRPRPGSEWWDDVEFFDELPAHVTGWRYCQPHNAAAGEDWEEQDDMPHWIEPAHLCKPGTGITAMWQQAVWEGYDPIYLLGVDGGFEAGKPEESHMHPDYYDPNVRTSAEAAAGINRTIKWQHEMMEQWSNANGRRIYTLVGAVDAHERMSVEMVLH